MEDGELPRVPVAFSLAPGKAATPQKAAPAASEAARPAGLPEKGSAAPASGDASITPYVMPPFTAVIGLCVASLPSRALIHNALNP